MNGFSGSVNVDLGDRSYPVVVRPGLIDDRAALAEHVPGSQLAVISNPTVADLYLERFLSALGDRVADVHLMPDGERFKSLDEFGRAHDFLMQRRHNRTTTVVALGGGVVGDLAGFVAATFQRGVRFVQVPTTLLAQVDSSVGGKTAVNHPAGKNMIGAFYQPSAVLADLGTLDSLPEREFLAGMAEVIKYGVIFDAEFFSWLEANVAPLLARDADALAKAVSRSVEIKAAVVAQDEREAGLRAILNYGHTFGHAIETLTDYGTYLHGEAVAIGMLQAADLAVRSGDLPAAEGSRVRNLVNAFGLPCEPPQLSREALLGAMGMDKKVADGRLRLVLPQAIGQVQVTSEFDPEVLAETLSAPQPLAGTP